ncbi:MAG: DUF1330 domain-containing protein [Pseudonocardia sp.]
MTAYVISDVVPRDPALVATYRERARAAVESYGGRYLSNVGGAVEAVEGDWAPANVVIVAFPSMERARAWYRSPEYGPALEVRERALSRNLILVEGADEAD